jgi:hypothetical protein
MTDDLPFTTPEPDPTRPERKPARCRVHRWVVFRNADYFSDEPWDETRCDRCGKVRDATASKRGRNNRKRGTSDELEVARILGGHKMGPLGLSWDVEIPGYARVQCKKLDRWPSLAKVVEWLDAIPAGPELRAVTLADAPGHGKVRRLIVLDLTEFAAWHGKEPK